MERIDSSPLDPDVTDPPGFDVRAAWTECQAYSDRMHACERPIAAAAGADPGICSCPACGQMYWAWGRKQRCRACSFEYPTDAWAMYSWGCQFAGANEAMQRAMASLHKRRLPHPYYRYGFEHPPVGDIHDEFKRIDWKAVMGGSVTREQRGGDPT